MFKHCLVAVVAAVSFPSLAQEYQATTTTNVIVRQAPGPTYQKIGVIPAGTEVSVEICFDRGAFCKVGWDGQQAGFVSGELMTVGGTGETVQQAEEGRWKAIEAPKEPSTPVVAPALLP